MFMIIDLNYNDEDFKSKIINLEKGIKVINVDGDNIDVNKLCDILENIKKNVLVNTKVDEKIKEEFSKRGTFQGFNRSILNMVKKICNENVNKSDIVVDMTVGNGNDTLFLSGISKMVYGFDIQDEAINNTKRLLTQENVNNYKLFKESHDKINEVLCNEKNNIKLILFNLGYLPCGDKSITTMHDLTLRALCNSLEMLKNDGLILMVFYPHPEGKMEEKVVLDYLNNNNISYETYRNTINMNAPYLVVIRNIN